MFAFPLPTSAQVSSIIIAGDATTAPDVVPTVDGISRSDTYDDVEPQLGTALVYREGSKSAKRAKWTDEEDVKFRKLAAAVAIKKDLPVEEKREFLLLQQRRRQLQLRVSAEQKIWDLRDREFRSKARTALEEYFEFLESAS